MLESGQDFSPLHDARWTRGITREELCEAWERHKGSLPRFCWGWWEFEAPEPKRRTTECGCVIDPAGGLWFGVPALFVPGPTCPLNMDHCHESNDEYARRLEL